MNEEFEYKRHNMIISFFFLFISSQLIEIYSIFFFLVLWKSAENL